MCIKRSDLRFARCFINQPSNLQPLHAYHGLEVIAFHDASSDSNTRCVYPTSGPIISMEIPKQCLSYGWPSLQRGRNGN